MQVGWSSRIAVIVIIISEVHDTRQVVSIGCGSDLIPIASILRWGCSRYRLIILLLRLARGVGLRITLYGLVIKHSLIDISLQALQSLRQHHGLFLSIDDPFGNLLVTFNALNLGTQPARVNLQFFLIHLEFDFWVFGVYFLDVNSLFVAFLIDYIQFTFSLWTWAYGLLLKP